MKKGFTLVEIMVVVIIMGVLAAVGVPKLFGVIAKARAAEVPVAAGTYVSLQNAYLHENNGIGSWKNIGYGAPGNGQTEYFDYSGCINGTIPFANMEPDMPGWQASNRSNLNSCKTGGAWAIVIDPSGEREIDYRQIISSADCAALTVSWGVVGNTVEGMCETTGELHVAGTENKEPSKPETPAESSEDTPSEPETSSPSSSASTESSNSKQGDCDALAASIKNDNGNKYGWVCVAECGLFAPPGKARNAGFTVEKSQKKKNTGGTCEKVEPETPSGNTGSQAAEANSSAATSAQSTGGSSGSTGSTSGGAGATGGTGGTSGGTSSVATSSAESINMSAEASSSSAYPGYNGFGEPHAYDSATDYCEGTASENGCDGTYRPNSECKTWSYKDCNNNGNGSIQDRNKTNCGLCTGWKKK